jgi:high affinity sulfate transporter 1
VSHPGGLGHLVPGAATLRAYRVPWLKDDLLAGLALTAVLVPAGMGYAQAAGLPAVTGLYASIAPLAAYAVLGPSRILVLGPDSALIALIASTVLPAAAGSPARAVALASTLAILTGGVCVAGAALRAGFAASLISKPIRFGYVNGIAVTVIVGQIAPLCGFSTPGRGFVAELAGLVHGLAAGETVPAALAIGGVCVVLILGLRRAAPRVPGVLIAVVLAAGVVAALGLSSTLHVVGTVPSGLPRPGIPAVGLADIAQLAGGALAIALVAFADTSALSRTYAVRGRQDVDANRELLALGAANVAAGFFHGFPVSSSASRTPVAESSGARTQLAGLAAAVAIGLLLSVAPGLIGTLPTTALAAVVISAALGLFEIAGVRKLWRLDRPEFLLSMASFAGVVTLGVLPGVAIAIGLSLLDFVRHAWRPHDAVLGRVAGMKGYHDVARHPDARQVPGLLLFRWDAPLFFANADLFRERIVRLVGGAPGPIRSVVVAAEPITDVDSTAAEMLERLHAELAGAGIGLGFAELKGPVKDTLNGYGLLSRIGGDAVTPTLGTAVKQYLAVHDVEWTDWEDEGGPQQAAARGGRSGGRMGRENEGVPRPE